MPPAEKASATARMISESQRWNRPTSVSWNSASVAVDVPALVVRGAERLEHAFVARRGRGLVDGQLVPVVEGVQGQQFPLRALIPVEFDIVREPGVGIPLGAMEVGPGQKLQDPAAGPQDQQVGQEQDEPQVERKAPCGQLLATSRKTPGSIGLVWSRPAQPRAAAPAGVISV